MYSIKTEPDKYQIQKPQRTNLGRQYDTELARFLGKSSENREGCALYTAAS
jgi:hypothetical protein